MSSTTSEKASKKSVPLWRDFDLKRSFIWSTWIAIYAVFFLLPNYTLHLGESVYLLVKIGLVASIVLVPLFLMPFVGTSKILGHFLKTIFYPIVIPFIVLSLFLEIRKFFKKIVEHPLLGVLHYSVIFLTVVYGFSVREVFVWEFLTPLFLTFVVTNILWATAWICKPMRFIASINGLIEKNKTKIVGGLAKNFLKTKKIEDSKSVITLTEGLIKLFEKLNSPFLITIIFIMVMLPVLVANICLFALVLKGEFLTSSNQAFAGELFSPDNVEFLKISIASFIGHDLHGVEVKSVMIQNILLFEAVTGMYFLVGIFFAYSSFGLVRAADTIKNFQDLVRALSDMLKDVAKGAGLEEGNPESEEDKGFIDAQFSLKVKKDGSKDFKVN